MKAAAFLFLDSYEDGDTADEDGVPDDADIPSVAPFQQLWDQLGLDKSGNRIAKDLQNISDDLRCLVAAAKALRTLEHGNQLPLEFGFGWDVDVSLVTSGWAAAWGALTLHKSMGAYRMLIAEGVPAYVAHQTSLSMFIDVGVPELDEQGYSYKEAADVFERALNKSRVDAAPVDGYLYKTALGGIQKEAWEYVTLVGAPSHKSNAEQVSKRLAKPLDLCSHLSLDDIESGGALEDEEAAGVFVHIPAGGPLEEAAQQREYQRYLLDPGKFKGTPPVAEPLSPVNVKPDEDRSYYLRHLSNTNDPVAELTEVETLAAVREWFETLPAYEQSILKMYLGLDLYDDVNDIERQWTYEEIAEHLGSSKSKVERDIKKVLKKGLLEMIAAAHN